MALVADEVGVERCMICACVFEGDIEFSASSFSGSLVEFFFIAATKDDNIIKCIMIVERDGKGLTSRGLEVRAVVYGFEQRFGCFGR